MNRSQLQDAAARGDITALDAVRRDNPQHAPSQLFLGVALYDSGDHAAALPCFDEVLRLQPYNELAAAYRGLTLMAGGRDDEGRDILRTRGLSDNQGFLVRLTEWIETQWLDSGRFFDPKPVALEPAPGGSRRAAERRASRAFYRHDWKTVVFALDPFIQTPKPDADAVFAAALASEMLHDNERALAYLSRLVSDTGGASAPDTESLPDIVRAARARNLVRLRQFREAAADLNTVLIIGPEDFGVNYYLGVLCLAAGQRDRAREMFARAYRDYMVDTLEYQFAALKAALLSGD